MNNCFKVLTRKKVLDPVGVTETQLARVLNTYDLTALGVGSTLGVGVYVLAGHVARDTAGPAVVLSFLIAAIASVFAGLCYAEFGSRVPRAGSAYVYSYVCVGEFIAFVIGWNLILEYVIGSASVARGLSLYLDTLINNTLQDTFREIAPINVSFMSTYFDFFSFSLAVILAAALAFGMKESSRVNNVFTILNILVVLFVIIAGSIKANPKNWDLPAPSNTTYGTGGFFPYGFSGMIKGAATCFYGFVGFDCIATTGEEVKNPQRAIPLSIIASLLVIFLAYFGTATVVTLMVPYYLQDINAPIPHAFAEVGWEFAKWIVAIGGIFGLCASLFGAMFPLPRVIYAMASDGIIFKFLGKVSARFHTPLIGTLLAGLLTGLMSALFDLKQLVNMMSIGTLLAYTIVAACVLLLRYADDGDRQYSLVRTSSESDNDAYTENETLNNMDNTDSTELIDPNENVTFCGLMKQVFNFQRLQNPTKTSQTLVTIEVCIFAVLSLSMGLCVTYLIDQIRHARIWAIVLVSAIGLCMILVLMSIATQPNSKKEVRFKVPLVPLIPALSILVNIYLMLMLDVNTWIRFGVWMAVGLPMYFISVRCADSFPSNSNNPKMHAKVNGNISHTNKSNGHINPGLMADDTKNGDIIRKKNEEFVFVDKPPEILTSEVKIKSKAPLPPPAETQRSSPDSLSVNGALAALDEVLSKEEHASSFVAYNNTFDRKASIDTVSNASNMFFEESVVALVHHEDSPDEFHRPIIEEQAENDSQSSSSMKNGEVKELNEHEVQNKDPPDDRDHEHENDNDHQTEKLKNDNNETKTETENDDNSASPLQDDEKNAIENKREEPSYVPPPPPSMKDFESFVPRIPRISLTSRLKDDMHSIQRPTLKPVGYNRSKSETDIYYNLDKSAPDTPLPDYAVSRKTSIVDDVDDNITFGSKQHVKVMSKLNSLLVKKSMGLPIPNKLTKPEVVQESEKQEQAPVSILPGLKYVLQELPKSGDGVETVEAQGVVVEEVMKPADIKRKLNEILRSDPRLTMRPLKSNIAVSSIVEQSELNSGDANESKVDSSSEDKSELSAEVMAQLQHKNLMGNTLRSIKLRKVDSFKTD